MPDVQPIDILAGTGLTIPDYDETWSRFLTETNPDGRTVIVGHCDWRQGRTDDQLRADGYDGPHGRDGIWFSGIKRSEWTVHVYD